MPPFESAELVGLFTAYTAGPDSIGAHLAETVVRESARDPLLVATGTDLALFPGDTSAPAIEPYRLSTRGFKELAAISHLGPALATLARMREADPAGCWRGDAGRLLEACQAARAANSAQLWRERIAVRAFAGREEAIAAMADYSCRLTERRLERALDDPSSLTMAAVRRDFLDGPAGDLPVPFNRVMIATFFLSGLDIAYRLIGWFDALDIDWERAMIIVAGRAGRPTAGVTEESNSVAGIVRAALTPRADARRPHCSSRRTHPGLPAVRRYEPARSRCAGDRVPPAVGLAAGHLRPRRADVRGVPAVRGTSRRAGPRRRGLRERAREARRGRSG